MALSQQIFIKMKVQDIFPTYNLYTYFMNKRLIFYSIVILTLILLIIFLLISKEHKEKITVEIAVPVILSKELEKKEDY